jgi:mannose-6-phosphate isomerase-like protein (cupin superfamily)
MSSHSVKNLLEIDPAGDGENVEIRFSRKYIDSQQLGISYERYAPGFTSTAGHRHDVQEEAYVVVEGSGAIKLDDERVELKRWDVVRVAPEVVRGFDAGPDGLVLIAVGGEKPEGGDGHLVQDRWPAS